MNNDQLIQLLLVAVAFIFVILVIVIIIGIMASIKTKNKNREEEKKEETDTANKSVYKPSIQYEPESIFDFMEFDKIEDDMIIKKRGKFLMVVECQGINYDLMSEMEKVSVEQGFTSFLNTLRYPIQLYIQTRTVNLEKSIQKYKTKLKEIKDRYSTLQEKYEKALKADTSTKKELDTLKYELLKQRNLIDYTEDVIRDTERTSLNNNVLNKKYFVIVPCYQSEIETGDFAKEEIQSMAFSELYTRCRNIISSLYTCQVMGKILNSEELVELLYNAYNRDDSERFSIEKVMNSGYEDLYSTAPDVLDKKMKLIDEAIEKEALDLANKHIKEARNEKEIRILEKQKSKDKEVKELAKDLIKNNEKYLGKDITEMALEKVENIDKTKEDTSAEGGDENVQKKTKRGKSKRSNE